MLVIRESADVRYKLSALGVPSLEVASGLEKERFAGLVGVQDLDVFLQDRSTFIIFATVDRRCRI